MNDPRSALSTRKHRVPEKFDRVAHRYDLLASLNPGYSEHLRLSARRLDAPDRGSLLDLCCGTGISTAALRQEYPNATITGLDASADMLAQARSKEALRGIDFRCGDAMDIGDLPGEYDAILMAYGIRNMPDADRCLAEVLRRLRPGGAVCFHEYSVADSRLGRAVWNAVSLGLIIPLGFLTSPRSDIYRYLRRSVLDFDGVSEFEARLRRHGFSDVRTEPVTGWQRGIVHSFLARRPS
jgi:ubiquinone/menaquinone biosynthesis methyltransferase